MRQLMHHAIWLSLLICIALAGCSRQSTSQSELAITLTVTPNPPRVGLVTIELVVVDRNQQPITGATVMVEGSMTHAGMTPEFAPAEETAPGRYTALLVLTMGGDWLVTVSVTMLDGRTIEQTLPLGSVQ